MESKIKEQLKSKTFSLTDKNKMNYKLKIFLYEESIGLSAYEAKENFDTEYKKEFSYEELLELSNIFKMYESIDDIYDEFFDNFEESDISLNIENLNFIVSFKAKLMKKTENINFILIQQKIKIGNLVYCLSNSNEIDDLKKKIDSLKNKIDNYFGFALDYDIEEFDKLFKEIKTYTRIIGGVQDFNLILNGIKKTVNKKIKNIKLLMRATIDGNSSSTFHQKCDNKSFTLVLVITDKNRRFGGFASTAWDQSGNYKTDTQSFIFSFDNQEVYYPKNINSQSAIYCNSSYCPAFGNGYDFYIASGCTSNNSSSDNTSSYHYNTQGRKNVLAMESNFKVLDYEVFQLEFV